MKACFDRKALLTAFNMVAGVVPTRSPKPVLQNVKLSISAEGEGTLMGTDLEIGIRYDLIGVDADQGGSVLLPAGKLGSILKSLPDESLTIRLDADHVVVRGARANFKLAAEDPSEFPEPPEFRAEKYHQLAAEDLAMLIRRTSFATDVESARYALGGCLVELEPARMSMVATDGRRLAKMTVPAESVAGSEQPKAPPVVPLRALNLIERNLAGLDMQVRLAFEGANLVLVRAGSAVISSRLVEGRYPRYQDVFPTDLPVRIPMMSGPLRRAIEQAAITTSEESRGVDFAFNAGSLRLSSKAADVGLAHVEHPIEYQGDPVLVALAPQYLLDALKSLKDETPFTAEMIDGKTAVMFSADDYRYLVMPLTREH